MEKIRRSIFLKLACAAFAAVCVFTIVRMRFVINDYKNELADVNAALEEENSKVDELQRQLDEPLDDQNVRDIAREKLDLRNPEEIVIYSDK